MKLRSTREVEQLLKVNNLAVKIYRGRIDAPEKKLANQYMWTPEDIEKASWVLRGKSADDVLPVPIVDNTKNVICTTNTGREFTLNDIQIAMNSLSNPMMNCKIKVLSGKYLSLDTIMISQGLADEIEKRQEAADA